MFTVHSNPESVEHKISIFNSFSTWIFHGRRCIVYHIEWCWILFTISFFTVFSFYLVFFSLLFWLVLLPLMMMLLVLGFHPFHLKRIFIFIWRADTLFFFSFIHPPSIVSSPVRSLIVVIENTNWNGMWNKYFDVSCSIFNEKQQK